MHAPHERPLSRKRRAKTDRIDARKLLRMLMRYRGGERKLWSVVRVPSVEDEDARSLNRELEALRKERTMHRNRIRGLLIQQGLEVDNPSSKRFLEQLNSLPTWVGAHSRTGYIPARQLQKMTFG
jgi:transposase